jgi:tRNA pseudouridine(38-40) synthase
MNNKLVNRYFMKFSYAGNRYNGVAKQTDDKSVTVHNVIESYLKNTYKTIFKDFFELKSHIHISSRTDAGVHAFLNTAHFDLIIKNDEANLNNLCKQTRYVLNRQLIKNDHSIRYLCFHLILI